MMEKIIEMMVREMIKIRMIKMMQMGRNYTLRMKKEKKQKEIDKKLLTQLGIKETDVKQ